MDAELLAYSQRLDLDPAARSLWDAGAPHLEAAVSGEDTALLAALEGVARSAALSGLVPVAALLDAYNEGCGQLCRQLEGTREAEARDLCLRLRALDRVALSHIATGYAAGLEETIDALRRAAEDESPVDAGTGALKPRELAARLALEVERCRRTDGPLGLVALGPVCPDGRGGASQAARAVARRLGAILRRYDSIGLTGAGDLVVVMPDVSRRGLVAAAERLAREAGRPRGGDGAVEVVCTFHHFDDVDQGAPAILAALEEGLDAARYARGRAAC